MKVKIIIQSWHTEPADNPSPFVVKHQRRSSEVWSGEIDILDDTEYLAKISIIGEGIPQPIADIPFAIGIGHYMWIPPSVDTEKEDDAYPMF